MNLLQCLAVVLAELGAGALAFTALLPTGEIRPGFFAFQAILGTVAFSVAALLGGFPATPAAVVVIGGIAAAQAFRHERLRLGRGLLAVAGTAAVVALLWQMTRLTTGVYPPLFAFAGFLLVGATHTAMVLGHWYLLMRQLSFGHLIRFTWLALAATLLRAGLLLGAIVIWHGGSSDFGALLLDRALRANRFFFGARVAMGVVAPLVFTGMATRCAHLHANQAATGLLYLSEAFVFFGELFAVYLLL